DVRPRQEGGAAAHAGDDQARAGHASAHGEHLLLAAAGHHRGPARPDDLDHPRRRQGRHRQVDLPPSPPNGGEGSVGGPPMRAVVARIVTLGAVLLVLLLAPSGALAGPEGTLTFALHFSPVNRWLDPAEGESTITPYLLLYALHDGLMKPMPGSGSAPSLAESWSMARDGLSADFLLRQGVKFHHGEPVTAEDVKFSFERYRGGAAKVLKDHVKEIQVLGPQRVRFVFKEPWPDFPAFYGTFVASAGWVVPKKYMEQVGEEGFRKAPVGAGPYKFVSFKPGVELVLEAFEGYWRKAPSIKRLVFRSLPDETTRAAALKAGEVD